VPPIGETLREARMRQHLDITDVEARTKIRAKYLRALENEDFGMLPGPTFVKSFLRTYAEFLGLDPHLLVEEYRVRHDPRDESELTPFARAPAGRQRTRPPRRPSWLPAVLVVGAIVAVLLILGLTGGSSSDQGTTTTTTQTTSAKKTPAKPKPAPKTHVPRRFHSVSLRIAPASATYICVDEGAGTKVIYEGTTATPKSWKARHLRVNLGRREVKITVNHKHVTVPSGADPIGYDFTPNRTRVMAAGQTRPCG
jgi:Helix-turn-helix domain